MGVGWGVWSWPTIKTNRVEGENVLVVHDWGGLRKCKIGTPHSHEGLGVGKGHQ